MAKIIKWRGKQIAARPRKILGAYGPVIGEELKSQIATAQFDWPNPTLRFTSKFLPGLQTRGGVLIDASPRDAVDTGRLMDSQTAPAITASKGSLLFNIKWLAPYSGVVLRGGDYGEYINPEGKLVNVDTKPGRNWISPALQQQPLKPFFLKEWRRLSRG